MEIIKPQINFILTKSKKLFLLLILLISIFKVEAQTSVSKINWQPDNAFNFYTYPALPHRVQGFAQDKYGYMWIGSSDGLYRFDGINYKRFVYDDGHSNSINSNNCIPLLVDSSGILWIHTSTGLSMLNTSTYQFRNFNFSDTLLNDAVTGVVEDKEKNIWLCSMGRKNLTKYEPVKNKFTAYIIPDSLYVEGMRTFGFTYNQDGKIYVAADYATFIFNPAKSIYEKRILQQFPDYGDTLYYCGTHRIMSDKNGTIYTGNWNNWPGKIAIGVFNRERQCIVNSYTSVDQKYYSTFLIAEKSDSELWVGTNLGGLFIYNKKTNLSVKCEHHADDALSFPENEMGEINSVLKDDKGCFWFNSNNRIVKLDPLDNFVKGHNLQKLFNVNGEGFNATSVLKLPEKSKLLIGTWTGAGFYEIDLNRHELKKDSTYTNLQHTHCELQKIMKDRTGKLWAFSQHLIYKYDSTLKRFNPCKVNPPFPGDPNSTFSFTSMFEDSRGHFWLGTFKHGFYDFNPADNSYISYPKVIYNPAHSAPDFIKPCFEDYQQNVWFTSYDGVYLFNLNGKSFGHISYKTGDKFYNDGRDLLKDKNGNIWRTSAGGGFQKFNFKTKLFELVLSNIDSRQIRFGDMVEDNEGYIWITTEEEICRFDPVHNLFQFPKQTMNLEMGNSILGYCKEDGTLYTGKGNMLFETNTNNFNGNINPPRIVFNSFKVFNHDTLFSKNLNDLDSITLSFDKNFISIEFAALNFSHSENNLYAYKLDGMDNDWVMNGNKNFVSYSNLAPGEYLFHVKASNNTGLWNDVGRRLTIIITPPWWQTWWALIAFVLFAIGFIIFNVRLYTQFKLRKQRNEIEKQKALQNERARISHDLHDDLGSGLTSIAMLSEVIKNSKDTRKISQSIEKISSSSHDLVDHISEIVWAMNPKNDTLENLISYIHEFASEFFENTSVKISFALPDLIPVVNLSGHMRRNIFLVVKESLHNIIKHALAQQVNMVVVVSEKSVFIIIKDNGNGFNISSFDYFAHSTGGKGGNGLQNMNQRMKDIGGEFIISSSENAGTETKIVFTI